MRHAIQKGGHEVLPFLYMLVATGTGVLFYLGNIWPGTPPGYIIVPVLVTLAISTEWLTFTFNQDMQDACTARRGRGFPILRALLASAVSAYIFATASSGLWAPRGANDKVLWAWILAMGVFGSQFLLKIVPEKRKAPHSLVNIGAALEEWMPDATVEEQARMASRVFSAISGADSRALPEPAAPRTSVVEMQPEARQAQPQPNPKTRQGEERNDDHDEAPLPGEYTDVPVPGVRAGAGNHRYTGNVGGPFRPTEEG